MESVAYFPLRESQAHRASDNAIRRIDATEFGELLEEAAIRMLFVT
jgi:hypothetical protein